MTIEGIAAGMQVKQDIMMKKQEREIMEKIGGEQFQEWLEKEAKLILEKQEPRLSGAADSAVASHPEGNVLSDSLSESLSSSSSSFDFFVRQ
jgi:hypothetical protein